MAGSRAAYGADTQLAYVEEKPTSVERGTMMSEFTADDLKAFQSEPLFPDKFQRSMSKISEAYAVQDDRIVVGFSGGKDSSVLADMAAQWCRIKGVPLNLAFSNTGLEYPEVQKHVPSYADYLRGKYGINVNLAILRPEMQFNEVISRYGYPIIGKEVAEAIYYARRIRNDAVERERESKRAELQGKRDASFRKASRMEMGGAEQLPCPDISSEKQTDNSARTNARSRGNCEWADWRRRCL